MTFHSLQALPAPTHAERLRATVEAYMDREFARLSSMVRTGRIQSIDHLRAEVGGDRTGELMQRQPAYARMKSYLEGVHA